MAILSISRDWGTDPSLVRITTTDNLATITAAGYLTTQEDEIDLINNGAFEWLETDAVLITYADGKNTFQRNATTNAFELLGSGGGGGSIAIPTLTDHIIVALDNAGNIGNILTNQNKTARFNGIIQSGLPAAGNPGAFYCYSSAGAVGGRIELQANQNTNSANVSIENRAHAASAAYLIPDCGAISADFIISNFPGTQIIESGSLRVDAGNITAVGDIISESAPSNTGKFILRADSTIGNFDTIIKNDQTSQQTTYILSNIDAITASIVTSTNASAAQKTVVGVGIAGGGVTSNIVDTFCTTTSMVEVVFLTQTNPASIRTVLPLNGSFTVATDVAPGASTISYKITN